VTITTKNGKSEKCRDATNDLKKAKQVLLLGGSWTKQRTWKRHDQTRQKWHRGERKKEKRTFTRVQRGALKHKLYSKPHREIRGWDIVHLLEKKKGKSESEAVQGGSKIVINHRQEGDYETSA